VSDPLDYPRCEICVYCAAADKCTHPGPVKMGWSYMRPAGNYDSFCDKFQKDEAALRLLHKWAVDL
jgi:hypothetical protein